MHFFHNGPSFMCWAEMGTPFSWPHIHGTAL